MNLTQLDLKQLFPYKLDDFQQEAIYYLDQNKSVLVVAPTGSGKTVIGEYAIYRALSQGKRVFYTTPLKALSNQKFRDFQRKFGRVFLPDLGIYEEVGLITGDVSINPNAPVVVMTTEIFRNMLYATPIGEVGTSLWNVQTVVLDECHYISEPSRGTVWEESIIYCPPHIQLVALSATIGNPEQLCDWINTVRRSVPGEEVSECVLINSNFRPVPLKFYFSHSQGLFPLLDEREKKLNPQLRKFLIPGKNGRFSPKDCPSVKTVVQQLQNNNMLPAIYVIFSRRACDEAVKSLPYLNLVTVEESRQILLYLLHFLLIENIELQIKVVEFAKQEHQLAYERILGFIADPENGGEELVDYIIANPIFKARFLQFLASHSEVARTNQIEPLTRGIAAHHAGILPAWKELVERLFEMGLVKIVFATATLAAGINMPARTTVISALRKRSDDGHRLLTPSEFLQIAGRAGRRGMDKVGYVVTVQTPNEGVKMAFQLAKAPPEPLRSQFTPSYGMVLNLLQKHTLEETKDLLELSFAEYLARLQLAPHEEAIRNYTKEIAKLDVELAPFEAKELVGYEKLKERKKQEQKILKLFEKNWLQQRQRFILPLLDNLPVGTILHLSRQHKKNSYQVDGVFLHYHHSGNQKFLVCLGSDNCWYLASFQDVVDINDGKIPLSFLDGLSLPPIEQTRVGMITPGDEQTVVVARAIAHFARERVMESEEIVYQRQRLEEIERQITAHPLHQVENINKILKKYRKRQKLKQELAKVQVQYQRYRASSSYYWQEFLALVEVLQEFEALDGYRPTPLGETAAAIRGENELWLGLALKSGHLDYLEPHQLAGAITALTTEPLRGDLWVAYEPSAEVLDALGLRRDDDYGSVVNYPQIPLSEIRRRLYQAQNRRSLTIPVWLERDLIGLAENWCLGASWEEICNNTTLDEGDIVRVLRRTTDVLMQLPQVPGLDLNLVKAAKEAVVNMKRFPVL